MILIVIISFFTKRADEEQLSGITYLSQTPEQKVEARGRGSEWGMITSLVVFGYLCCILYLFLVKQFLL